MRGKAVNVPVLRPETFADAPAGVAFPPGTTLVKVTNPENGGPGTYLGFHAPPTSESAARRFQLPSENRASEVRILSATCWLVGNIGVIAGSPTKDLQFEAHNPQVLAEVSRRRLLDDVEAHLYHAAAGVAIGAAAGLIWGSRIGNPWLGLVLGIVIGFLVGLLTPTDWGDLFSMFFGAADVSLLFTMT
ncbi:MAG: hypothetical protein ACHQ2Y_00390 [Candidatus Lutacidiplasmatales archaeon]